MLAATKHGHMAPDLHAPKIGHKVNINPVPAAAVDKSNIHISRLTAVKL